MKRTVTIQPMPNVAVTPQSRTISVKPQAEPKVPQPRVISSRRPGYKKRVFPTTSGFSIWST